MAAPAIKPQEGFQEKFLSSSADIVIGGGAAGAGKTFAELIEPIRHVNNGKFNVLFLRRTMPQVTNLGGLWQESQNLYPYVDGQPHESKHTWKFPSGMQIKFGHLQHEKTKNEYQGSQFGLIIFDEVTHFTETQFFYMLSRNRSVSGVKPYIRATCNPDPASWVATFIEWWIDQETGFPIPERAGVVRYMSRQGDTTVWGNSIEEVKAQIPKIAAIMEAQKLNLEDIIKSVTFIPGSVYENRELLSIDPGYLGNLLAQSEEEQKRLLDGNWKISLDGLAVYDYGMVGHLFTNYPAESRARHYITCDAARFGADFCVIFVWRDWTIIHATILPISEVNDMVEHIERLRRKYHVSKAFVVVDQDGVGGGVVKLGKYEGFRNDAKAVVDPDTHRRENYKNYKTQCVFYAARKVNEGEAAVDLVGDNIEFVVAGTIHRGWKISHKGKVRDFRDYLKEDLRSFRRIEDNYEGKRQIEGKAEQKISLGGRSPDFGDAFYERSHFDLQPRGRVSGR